MHAVVILNITVRGKKEIKFLIIDDDDDYGASLKLFTIRIDSVAEMCLRVLKKVLEMKVLTLDINLFAADEATASSAFFQK